MGDGDDLDPYNDLAVLINISLANSIPGELSVIAPSESRRNAIW